MRVSTCVSGSLIVGFGALAGEVSLGLVRYEFNSIRNKRLRSSDPALSSPGKPSGRRFAAEPSAVIRRRDGESCETRQIKFSRLLTRPADQPRHATSRFSNPVEPSSPPDHMKRIPNAKRPRSNALKSDTSRFARVRFKRLLSLFITSHAGSSGFERKTSVRAGRFPTRPERILHFTFVGERVVSLEQRRGVRLFHLDFFDCEPTAGSLASMSINLHPSTGAIDHPSVSTRSRQNSLRSARTNGTKQSFILLRRRGAPMAISVTCPSCNRTGKLPDTFPGGKIKCSACGVVTEFGFPSGGEAKPAPAGSRPAAQAAPSPPRLQSFQEPQAGRTQTPAAARPQPQSAPAQRPQAQPKPKPIEEDDDRTNPLLDDDEIEELAAAPAHAAIPRAGARNARQTQEKSGNLTPILLGVGGGSALLLAIVVALLVNSGRKDELPAAPVALDQQQADAAQAIAQTETATPNAGYPTASNAGYTPPTPSYNYGNETRDQVIRRVKESSVYIKVKDEKGRGSGSGFVLRVDGNNVLVGTNRHVVSHGEGDDDDDDDDSSSKPADASKPKAPPVISVVFRSGEGQGVEQEVVAELLGADNTGDMSHDLAILSVKGVNNPPKPIDINRSTQPTEGMALMILGFPFGEVMNVAGSRGKNPAITINKASISSLRRDDRGRLALIQVDGSVQPGNSGGPVVDEQGRLIGVTVAKLSIADNFGLVIPASHVDEVLAGRVGKVLIELVSGVEGKLELQARAFLADPMGKLREVSVRFAPVAGDAAKPPAAAQPGNAAGVPNPSNQPQMLTTQSFPLKIDRSTKMAEGRAVVPVSGEAKQVMVQVSFVAGDGKTYFTIPRPYIVPSKPGRLVAVGERDSDVGSKIKKMIGKLGPLVDPDKDCKLTKSEKGMSISIPGKLHTHAPQFKNKQGKPINNAPMTLAKISGDFLIHVRVAGEMHPGLDPASDARTGRPLPISFQSGGIVLWQDKDNFIRLERSCGTVDGSMLANRLLVEIYRNGKEVGEPHYLDVPAGPMSLMMFRKSGHLRCLFSKDDKKWAILQEIAAEYSNDLQIGLVGVNMSRKPFTVEFDHFLLIDDPKEIPEEFKNL